LPYPPALIPFSTAAPPQGNDTQKLINNPSFVEFGQFTSYAGTGARYLKGEPGAAACMH
jgi:hypothetical protein